MADPDFRPIIYLKDGCPFCMKVDIFVLEAGLREAVDVRRFSQGADQEKLIRSELSPHFEKVSFPSAQLCAGEYSADSDAIIARLVAAKSVDITKLVTLNNYISGPFTGLMNLYKENMELKKLGSPQG